MSDELRLHELTYAEIGKVVTGLRAEVMQLQDRIKTMMAELERTQKELANRNV